MDIHSKNKRAFGPFCLSLDDIRPHLLSPNLKEGETVKFIKEMSLKFTARRDQIGDYVQDEDHVSSYAALYLPTNIPKLHFLLDKLPAEVLEDLKSRPLIDMGCGPGTFALGWSLLFEAPPAEVVAIDSSKTMLLQAEKILKGFFPEINLRTHSKFHEKKSDSVLFFGHSINEMGINKAQDLIMTIDPEYVIWIEPGTSELFRDLKKLRQILTDHYDVLYPCPGNAPCPSEWCHQVLRTSHDPSIERLSQLVSLDRKVLPMTAHVYRRKNKALTVSASSTLIQYINETKFSFEYEVCSFDGVENK
ncbi:MAG: small ribosomal subunit Rsm22 family protein, partial [Bacteriovorax sp.]